MAESGGRIDRASDDLEFEQSIPEPLELCDLHAQWVRIRARLKAEIGDSDYRAWLSPITLGALDGDEITLFLPTRFVKDWVRAHYGDRLRLLWQGENARIRRVDIRVGSATPVAIVTPLPSDGTLPIVLPPRMSTAATIPGQEPEPGSTPVRRARASAGGPAITPASLVTPISLVTPSSLVTPPSLVTPAGSRGEERADPRSDIAAPLDARFTFDGFVVGKPNEFAHACARRVAERPASPGFNPLFLYGGVGLGKTHLMHAIAWELVGGRPDVTVAYMSAEKFMYRFIASLRSQSTMEFKEQLRSVDVLMIDDLQFLIGKDSTQEEFFHTFNALIDAGKQIVLSADKSPSDLSGITDRLRTRLGCGMVADLHATTFELRISILEAKAARADVDVPPKVTEYLAHKITSNVRELEGALNRLIALTNLFGRPITLETTQEVLHDILRAHDRRVTIDEIQKRVCEHWNIRLTDMASARRARAIARPRQVAMYLAKQLTSRSLPEIGRKFGNRDHTTVMHAVSRVTELMARDAQFAEDVERLRSLLES